MYDISNFFNDVGKKIGYPFYVFSDGTCSKNRVSLDGKEVFVAEVSAPMSENSFLCVSSDKIKEYNSFDIFDIEGKSLKELLPFKTVNQDGAIFLTQNEKKEIFEKGNGEALRLVLNKFLLSDLFSQILFKRGLENLVRYYLEIHGYSQNLENSITEFGSPELISMIVSEARFSKDALIKLIERGYDGIILLYLRKKEETCIAHNNIKEIGFNQDVECKFVEKAESSSLEFYIKRYGLTDSSVKALVKRDEIKLMTLYLEKINNDFSGVIKDKLNTLNSSELIKLYEIEFGKN